MIKLGKIVLIAAVAYPLWRWRWVQRLLMLGPWNHSQLIIRMCHSAPKLDRRHDYAAPSRRAAWILCLLCGLHPRNARLVESIVIERWRSSAAFLTVAEIRAEVGKSVEVEMRERLTRAAGGRPILFLEDEMETVRAGSASFGKSNGLAMAEAMARIIEDRNRRWFEEQR